MPHYRSVVLLASVHNMLLTFTASIWTLVYKDSICVCDHWQSETRVSGIVDCNENFFVSVVGNSRNTIMVYESAIPVVLRPTPRVGSYVCPTACLCAAALLIARRWHCQCENAQMATIPDVHIAALAWGRRRICMCCIVTRPCIGELVVNSV